MKTITRIFLFAAIHLFLAILLFWQVPTIDHHMEIDSAAYIGYVGCFEQHGTFYNPEDPVVRNWYSIGYPAFMAMIRFVFGRSYNYVIYLQILASILNIFMIFYLASHFFSQRVALFSAFFASINIGYLVYSQLILTEVLLGFLILISFERYICYLKEKNLSVLAISGLVLGVSVLVKAAGLYFAALLILFLIFLTKRLKPAAIFFLFFSLPVSSYILRNKNVYGHYYLKSVDKVNFYQFFLSKLLMEGDEMTEHQSWELVSNLCKDVEEFGSGKGWERAHETLVERLKEHPVLAAKIWLMNVMKTFLGLFSNQLKILLNPSIRGGSSSFFKFEGSVFSRGWQYLSYGATSWHVIVIGIFELIWNIARYLLAAFASYVLLVRRRFLTLSFLLSYICYFALITGHDGCARFRLIFEAPLLILTAFGVCLAASWIQGEQTEVVRL